MYGWGSGWRDYSLGFRAEGVECRFWEDLIFQIYIHKTKRIYLSIYLSIYIYIYNIKKCIYIYIYIYIAKGGEGGGGK